MCGIAAILHYAVDAPPVDVDALRRIRDAMRARGPDGKGLWVGEEGRCGLGHRRLAVIDPLERSAQPMTLGENGPSIVFNGEIYNHADLRAELERRGERFTTTSDTEVLLRLYARDGEAMLPRLRGMFAFCVWDPHRRELFCARDPLGIKPLYLADDGRSVRLASQVKALLAGGDVDTTPDPAGHAGFFLLGSVPEPHTLYQGIRALPPGSWIRFGPGGQRHEGRFFHLPTLLRESEPATTPLSRERLAELLFDSVNHHRVSDVPHALFLSAGRDSATLAALAGEHPAGVPDTLTVAFDHPSVDDERVEARALAAHLGSRHHERLVTRDQFLDRMGDLIAAMDQPTIDGVNVYWTALAAGEAGYKVALSGLGGDELFGGYPSFRQIPTLVNTLGRLPMIGDLGAGVRRLTAPLIARITSPKYAGLAEYSGGVGDAWLLRRALFMPWELSRAGNGVLDAEMAKIGLRALGARERLEEEAPPPLHASVIALESGWYMRNQLLRDTDWAGMAHGVEIRVPLVDAALFQALAPWLISHTPPDKAAMATTPRRPLPAAILQRPKSGFGTPLGAWLADHPESRAGGGEREWARFVYREATGSPAV